MPIDFYARTKHCSYMKLVLHCCLCEKLRPLYKILYQSERYVRGRSHGRRGYWDLSPPTIYFSPPKQVYVEMMAVYKPMVYNFFLKMAASIDVKFKSRD